MKRSDAETVPGKASVHTRNATFGTISAPEQDYFAQFLKDLIPETQRSTYSCSHCTAIVSVKILKDFIKPISCYNSTNVRIPKFPKKLSLAEYIPVSDNFTMLM